MPYEKVYEKKARWYERHTELVGIASFLFAISQILALASFHAGSQENLLGLVGHYSAHCIYVLFGVLSLPLMTAMAGLSLTSLFIEEKLNKKQIGAMIAAFVSANFLITLIGLSFPSLESSFISYLEADVGVYTLGGAPCLYLYQGDFPFSLESLLNYMGTFLLFLTLFILSIGYLFEEQFKKALLYMKEKAVLWSISFWNFSKQKCTDALHLMKREEVACSWKKNDVIEKETPPSKFLRTQDIPTTFTQLPESLCRAGSFEHPSHQEHMEIAYSAPKIAKPKVNKLTFQETAVRHSSDYAFPSLDLLNTPKKQESAGLSKELKQKADLLEETLLSFGIEAKVGQIYSGPSITSFEVQPAVGVKVGRIKTLEHDIALNLEAKSIRIIAPIPGKAAVGIEVPNKNPQEVTFKEVLSSYFKQGSNLAIPMLLGKTVHGEHLISDLVKMPHCIIAGATGSGKSVCINAIIMTILMTKSPEEVRLLMIDPKKVELTPYSGLPHMLAPVIVEPQAACTALNWLVKEMERRYEILKLTSHRNIDAFNKRKVDLQMEQSQPIPIPPTLPYYVAIIDELADLMMIASQDIETPIARIAQMARAVGIHLILATQRPSREVITGLIKANFPARISFKVASRINSQIIIDDVGAETLLGNGDMLFLVPGSSQLVRAQGIFVRDEEISRVIEHIRAQRPTEYVIKSFDDLEHEMALQNIEEDNASDSLYEEAKAVVLSTGNASTTFLQRKLKIGYARAASLMDELERRAVVGPQDGSKPRKIFFPKSQMTDEEA